MNFRLNYHVSGETALMANVVVENIQSQLNEKKYDIVSIDHNSIKFKTNPWELRWNFSPTKLDGGEFELSNSNGYTMVALHYYENILPTLLIIAGIATISIADGEYEAIPFFSAFFLITGIIHVSILKSKARELLEEILNSDTE